MNNLMEASNSSLGQGGLILLTDTTAITGQFKMVQVLSDATFTTLTSDATKNGIVTKATGADYGTVSAGTIIYGMISAVTLATGTVILYK